MPQFIQKFRTICIACVRAAEWVLTQCHAFTFSGFCTRRRANASHRTCEPVWKWRNVNRLYKTIQRRVAVSKAHQLIEWLQELFVVLLHFFVPCECACVWERGKLKMKLHQAKVVYWDSFYKLTAAQWNDRNWTDRDSHLNLTKTNEIISICSFCLCHCLMIKIVSS